MLVLGEDLQVLEAAKVQAVEPTNHLVCVGIASLNTSIRDKKNLLEIRLDRSDFSINFNLSQGELDHLLT